MRFLRHLPRSLPHGTSRREVLEQSGAFCVAAGVFLCPFALGGAPLWSAAAAAGLFLAALTLLALSRHAPERAVRIFPAALALLAAAIAASLQLVPMPPVLLKVFAPANARALEQALTPLTPLGMPDLWPAWRPVSLDPPATARALLTILACLLGFLAASQTAVFPKQRTRLAGAISLSALLIALIGFAHALAGADALFGVFRFKQAAPPLLTPFGNPNHLAAFLIVGALFASCLAAAADSRTRQLFWSLAWFILATAIVLSLSRAGLAAFITGQILTAAALRKLSEQDCLNREGAEAHHGSTESAGPRLSVLALAAALASVGAASAYLAADRLLAEWKPLSPLSDEAGLTESKIALPLRALPMIREHWLTGVGKDAFEPAFLRFAETPFLGSRTATHPENIIADWLAGFGIPAGILLLTGLLAALVIGFRRAGTSPLRWTALIAVFAVFLDDLLNFSLSFVGTAVPVSAALAIGTAHRRQGLRLSLRAWVLLLPAVTAAASGAFLLARHDLRADGEKLLTAIQSGSPDSRQLFADAVSRHPLDYYPRLLAASKALAAGVPETAVRLAGNAMALFPAHPAPHAAAASALEKLGHFLQAATEWRMAQERGWKTAAAHLARLFAEGKIDAARITGIAPADEKHGLAFVDALRRAGAAGLAETHLDELERQHGRNARTLMARAALAESQGDMERLLKTAMALDEAEMNGTDTGREGRTDSAPAQGLLLTSRALEALGRRAEAIALLENRLGQKNIPAIRLRLTELKLRTGDAPGAGAVLAEMPPALTRDERVSMLRLKALAARGMKDFAAAADALKTAAILRPGDLDLRLALADALISGERFEAAMQELEQVRAILAEKTGAGGAAATNTPPNRRQQRLEQLTAAAKRGLADRKSRQSESLLRMLSSEPSQGRH